MGLFDAILGNKCQNCGVRVRVPLVAFGMMWVCPDCAPKMEKEREARRLENERLRREELEEARAREAQVAADKAAADRRRRAEDLHSACAAGERDAVLRHLAAGADVNARDWNGRTPLMMTAFGADVEMLKLLVGKGAELAAQNATGWTALHYAAAAGRTESVRVLVEAGAARDASTSDGKTAAQLAREKGHDETAEAIDG
ncbi:MAG: ankyrin repeat domain-containing protein [Deltaproteobacteria bacterium]|nr:ankyrin repeat domain-containing protein [Deltaproteobacteria bacterium]